MIPQLPMLRQERHQCFRFLLSSMSFFVCDEVMAQMIENVTALIRFLSSPDKVNHNESALLESKSSEERKNIFQQWSLELLSAVRTWSQSLEEGAFKTHGQCKVQQTGQY